MGWCKYCGTWSVTDHECWTDEEIERFIHWRDTGEYLTLEELRKSKESETE